MGKRRIYQGFVETDEKGKPRTFAREYLEAFFAQWPNTRFEIKVKKVNDHSDGTRRYYYGVIIPQVQSALSDAGMMCDPEETHAILKQYCPMFKETGIIKNNLFTRIRSLTDLDQGEMKEYFEWIAQFCAEQFDHVIQIE